MIEKKYDRDFKNLKKNVKDLLGFNTFQYKDTYLGRRFDTRLRAHHIDTYNAYWDLLRKDEAEQKKLLNDLTINVTEFFRDNSVYALFKNEVLPNVIKQTDGKIRIWSAGSSDGKEAYSIAMLAVEALGENCARSKVEIIATDVDRACLQKATNGVYETRPGLTQTDIEKQMRFIGHPAKYFDIEGNTYTAKPCLKQLVSFQYHDLISGLKKKNFDIIFCRNVVIYFNRELQEVLCMDYYNALNPGGYFVMGKTETLIGEARDCFKSYTSRERIFIKE